MPATAVGRAVLDRLKPAALAEKKAENPSASPGHVAARGTRQHADMDAAARCGLVKDAMRGDHAALDALWTDSRRWVATILLAHMPRGTSLDDLLQTVALQMCRRIGQLREPEAFRPWLRTVAINTARADGRALGRQLDTIGSRLSLVGTEAEHPARSPGAGSVAGSVAGSADLGIDTVAAADDAHRLLDLARELPEAYREPLLLRCARGMSYTQISAVLDLPETTIETRIARGRRMLREMIKQAQQAQQAQRPQHATRTTASGESTP